MGKKDNIHCSIEHHAVLFAIFAKYTIEQFKEKGIVRVMPNTMIEAKHGYSAVSLNEKTKDGDKEIIVTLLSGFRKGYVY